MIEQINVYSEMIPFRFSLCDILPLVSFFQTVTQRATWRWSGREASTRATSPRTTPSRSPSSTTWSGSRRSTLRRLPQVRIWHIAISSCLLFNSRRISGSNYDDSFEEENSISSSSGERISAFMVNVNPVTKMQNVDNKGQRGTQWLYHCQECHD